MLNIIKVSSLSHFRNTYVSLFPNVFFLKCSETVYHYSRCICLYIGFIYTFFFLGAPHFEWLDYCVSLRQFFSAYNRNQDRPTEQK